MKVPMVKAGKVQTREYGIDLIKVICILCIIVTHYDWAVAERTICVFPYIIDMAVPVLMVVTGYNYYNSMERNATYKKVLKNLSRILVPFLVVVLCQVLLVSNFGYSIQSIAYSILTGGYGPGSYYTVVMIQVILLYPLIYQLIKRKTWGMYVIIAVNLCFEIFVAITNFSPAWYRLLSLRYLAFLALGAAKAKNKDKKELPYIHLTVGAVLVFLVNYCGYEGALFSQWKTTSMLVMFLAYGYFLVLKKINRFSGKWIVLISQASFHIYLVQMCYYGFIIPFIKNYIEVSYWILPLNILICLTTGILFYKLENHIRKNIRKS